MVAQAEKGELENYQIPSKTNLSEVETAEMKHILSAIRQILSSVGIGILKSKRIESNTKVDKQEIIYECSVLHAKTKVRIEEDKYIVLQGSTAVIAGRSENGKNNGSITVKI